MRGATGVYPVKCHTCDFNPRTPRGVRRGAYTHTVWFSPYFNPRAPCGARLPNRTTKRITELFQSTRPVRGATFLISVELIISSHFNPRAPCGARLGILGNYDPVIVISIHAPRAGRDYIIGYKFPIDFRFQSTRPVRGATEMTIDNNQSIQISIHAPRAGRDASPWVFTFGHSYFNPRAPCGARPTMRPIIKPCSVFQSTRPVRGATFQLCAFFGTIDIISIHAPRAGRDRKSVLSSVILFPFQSTRPVRGATAKVYKITLHTFATKGNF